MAFKMYPSILLIATGLLVVVLPQKQVGGEKGGQGGPGGPGGPGGQGGRPGGQGGQGGRLPSTGSSMVTSGDARGGGSSGGSGGSGGSGSGSRPDESGSGDSRDHDSGDRSSGHTLIWLPIVIVVIAVAALLISLCAIALVLWLCCLRKRWRGRWGSDQPTVVVMGSRQEPGVFVVGNEKEKQELDLAPPSYENAVSKRPFSPIGSNGRSSHNSEPRNRPPRRPPTVVIPTAPPNSTRRVQSPSTDTGKEAEAEYEEVGDKRSRV